MKVGFRKSFLKDVRKLRDPTVAQRIKGLIARVEEAETPVELPGLVKVMGHPAAYRLRVGDWRLGLLIENDEATFVRVLHRREVYRYFP